MARQGNGVEVRANSIRLWFMLDGVAQRKTLMVGGEPMRPTAANIKRANAIGAEIRERIKYGTFVLADYFGPGGGDSGAPVTVGVQLDTWLAAQRLEGSTLAGYSSAVNFWKAGKADKAGTTLIGTLPLRALRKSHILIALAARAKLSGKTVNNYVSVLREALQLAVDDELLDENPSATVPRAKWQQEEPDPFSREEAELIIADMLAHYPEQVGNLVEWRFFSGVRTSEAFGLRWPSVDLLAEYTKIHEAVVRGEKKSKTKTAVARNVRMNSRSKAALTRQAKHTRLAAEYVWLDPRYGTPWTEERAFRRSYWTPTLKRLGIRYRPPNHMRHTYATMMLMAGRRPGWCAKQMGHSTEMFYRTYSKWLDGEQDDREIDALEAWLEEGAASTSTSTPRKRR
ncbi:MAG TPA: DUF3596 domain-containing protein [Burkholderiaceae bacterium]|nr:DUF3596 domain-containing protein [Burkholderiaceae bacterium]